MTFTGCDSEPGSADDEIAQICRTAQMVLADAPDRLLRLAVHLMIRGLEAGCR